MRAIAALLMACQLSACTSWRVEALSPAEVIQHQQPKVLRVEPAGGPREAWYNPKIRGDSLFGSAQDSHGNPLDRRLPLSDVTHVSTRYVSAAKTTALVLALGGLIAVFYDLKQNCCAW